VSWRRGSSAIAACSPAVKPLRAAPHPATPTPNGHHSHAGTGHRSWPDQPGSLPDRKPCRTGGRMLVVNTHSSSSGGSFASPPNSATTSRGWVRTG
jgi:hypothetical protein